MESSKFHLWHETKAPECLIGLFSSSWLALCLRVKLAQFIAHTIALLRYSSFLGYNTWKCHTPNCTVPWKTIWWNEENPGDRYNFLGGLSYSWDSSNSPFCAGTLVSARFFWSAKSHAQLLISMCNIMLCTQFATSLRVCQSLCQQLKVDFHYVTYPPRTTIHKFCKLFKAMPENDKILLNLRILQQMWHKQFSQGDITFIIKYIMNVEYLFDQICLCRWVITSASCSYADSSVVSIKMAGKLNSRNFKRLWGYIEIWNAIL